MADYVSSGLAGADDMPQERVVGVSTAAEQADGRTGAVVRERLAAYVT